MKLDENHYDRKGNVTLLRGKAEIEGNSEFCNEGFSTVLVFTKQGSFLPTLMTI